MTITEFIEARLAEDQAVARKAAGLTECWVAEEPAIGVVLVDGEPLIEGHIAGLTAHIALHDPARELRKVETGRRLLRLADEADAMEQTLNDEVARRPVPGELSIGDHIRRALAAADRDHPDYDPSWAPNPT